MARLSDQQILLLIETIAQGELNPAWEAANVLISAGSLRHGRKLIEVARRPKTIHAQQAALYAIWLLHDARACPVLLRIGADIESQTEVSRLTAVEALGVCAERREVQRALARHLTDPSLAVRYSALCALQWCRNRFPSCVIEALQAATSDPSSLYEEGDIAKFAQDLLAHQV